jgi:hypothetical protein
MSSSTLIGLWATGLWSDLGQPAQVSALTISGYATEPSTIGRLNNLISQCYSGSGYSGYGSFNYDVTPDYTPQELDIVGALYTVSYYNSLANNTMGYGGNSIPWTAIAEGDTKAARTNAASIGAVYAKQAQEAQMQLKYMVNVYINQTQGGNTPRDVEYWNAVCPTWSQGYIGNS